jgi:hypothetical protein
MKKKLLFITVVGAMLLPSCSVVMRPDGSKEATVDKESFAAALQVIATK